MYDPALIDVPIEQFGGYCPAIPPSELPAGASPFCQDVEFPEGSVRTRGGLLNFFGAPGSATNALPANAAVNGLKSYVTPTQLQRLLAWDSLGNLYKESPQGVLSQLFQRPQGAASLYQSNTLFGREYQAFFNAQGGVDIPRQYDDTNWDRVSQSGPGVAPTISDDNTNFIFSAVPAHPVAQNASGVAITNISQNGNVVTVICAGTVGFGINGENVVIAGVAPAAYNGTFSVKWSALAVGQQFTYVLGQTGLAIGVGGTASSQAAYFDLSIGDLTNRSAVLQLLQTYFPSQSGFVYPPFPNNAPNIVQYSGTGPQVTVSGVGVAGYNGTWTIIGAMTWSQVIGGFNHYFLAPIVNLNVTGLANSGGGQLVVVGSVAAGLHQVTICFITRQGYITKPAVPPASWTAAGNKRASLSNLATGPSYVVARLLLFTPVIAPPATTGSFYSITNAMLISDNTTTFAFVDFVDAILISSFQANYLFTQNELGESAFVGGYNSRTLFLGERARIQNFNNLGFDGGFFTGFPNGWQPDVTRSTGGAPASNLGLAIDWGDAYAITGDGATVVRGMISQAAFKDYLGVSIIGVNTTYAVRARIARTTGMVNGTIHVNLSYGGNISAVQGISVTAAQATVAYQEFIATFAGVGFPFPVAPADLALIVYVDTAVGAPTLNESFIIDSIEVFQLNTPYNSSTAWLSHAFNPESFDATTSQIQVRPSDGQQLRCGAPLRNSYYLLKDHYMGYTTDDGVNEPASWPFTEVSATIGACGPNAIDWTEEWFTFAERSGAYICWGGDPVKLTQEIQEDASATGKICWNSINWLYGHTIVVRIDQKRKLIMYAVPVNGATSPNCIFVLDYKWLNSPQEIAESPMVTYSAFTGKILSHGRGRRWTYWNMTINGMCMAERADNTSQPFFGNGAANGKIYQQLSAPAQLSDDGIPINSQYATYFTPSHIEEQALRFGAARKILGYLSWRAIGAGSMLIQITSANRVTNLRSYTLSLFPKGDGERALNLHGQRFSIQVGTDALNTWFQLEQLIPFVKKDTAIAVRGVNV